MRLLNMTDNVINIKDKRVEKVWTCDCGGQVFYLHVTGECECRECKLMSNGISNSLGDKDD